MTKGGFATSSPRPPQLSPTTTPNLCHPERSRGICCAPFSCHEFLQSSCIGHAEEPFFQQQCRKVTPGSEAAAIETHVPLLIRCRSSVKIRGGRKAHSRSLDCARDDKRGADPQCRGTATSPPPVPLQQSTLPPSKLKDKVRPQGFKQISNGKTRTAGTRAASLGSPYPRNKASNQPLNCAG